MASFEEILDRPATENKPPPAYPTGTYHCIIDGRAEPGMAKTGTKFLQIKFKIVSPYKDVDEEQAREQQIVGKVFTNDYYITDKTSHIITEMLVDHAGIELKNGTGGVKSLKELLMEAPGKQVLATLKHETSQDGRRTFHRLVGTAHV